jgi:hypothetical protein
MQHFMAVFWLFESEDFEWNVSVPFCPICEPHVPRLAVAMGAAASA